MKLKDFLTLKVGAGVLISGTRYSPHINYSWSQPLTVGGKQQIKDTGTAGLNLQQFFGQGCWFNGIDMQVTIPINATIQTEIKRVNGVTEINTNTQVLTSYNVYSGSGAKIYKDLYIFNRLLSEAEIEKYNNQPNQFFMDSLEDSSCILAMPMCEKDGFVRNYKSYRKSEKTIDKTNSVAISVINNTRIAQENIGLLVQADKTYEIVYDFLPNANFVEFKLYIPPTNNNNNAIAITIPISNFSGKCIFSVPSTYTKTNGVTSCYVWISVNGTLTTHTFKEISLKELTAIYPISNYLTTCRTNAQRLPYGLQTSGFKRDTNGLILSKSSFLEADGVGYGNTGWVPRANEDWSIEFIGKFVRNGLEQAHGTLYASATSRVSISVASNGAMFTRCGGLYPITGSNGFVENNVVMTYDSTLKIMKQFLNGVFIAQYNVSTFTGGANPLTLSSQGGIASTSIGDTRLFKIHQKVLTQEEITKNFNKYQAQGLLNE